MLTLLSYPRAILILVIGVFHTIALSIIVLAVAFLTRSRRLIDFIVNFVWSKGVLKPIGIDVEIRGTEYVNKTGKGFLILFNHTSLLDIPILFGYFPRSFRFGAKVELFKIPFFGKAMEAVGILPIDRGNRYQVMRVYEAAIARVENGECFALAPEGTRQESLGLGKFKRGPFEFAYNARMDVVPTVIAGVLDACPKGSIWINTGRWKRKVIVQITPPVAPMEDLVLFQNRVRAQMEPVLTALNQELEVQRV